MRTANIRVFYIEVTFINNAFVKTIYGIKSTCVRIVLVLVPLEIKKYIYNYFKS